MPKPIPFSSTWNVQSKVALKTIKQLQKGIRFHNGFFHWRQAGDEVGTQLRHHITLSKTLTKRRLVALSYISSLHFLTNGLRFLLVLIPWVFCQILN